VSVKAKVHSWITKDELMTYTCFALLALTAVSALSFGITSLIVAAVSVLVAVAIDYMFSKVTTKSQLNTMSAAVFGLIVALSYSLGVPPEVTEVQPLTMVEPWIYVFPALISITGMVLFKKLQSFFRRKYVNPAASAKLLVLAPLLSSALMPVDHTKLPTLTSPLYYNQASVAGALPFGVYLQGCYGAVPLATNASPTDVLWTLSVLKLHGWIGGVSSIAVIAAGLVLFLLCRRQIKWRITLAYLITTVLFAGGLNFIYGGDPTLRIAFHLFIGSSIFMAFFMATDPATTPLTRLGQVIFGLGLGVLTVLIQTYTNFLGGSILALVMMNFTTPILDKIGIPKPSQTKITRELPKAKEIETIKITNCIRCGECLVSCPKNLAPVLIKEAADKGKWEKVRSLHAEYCIACPPNCQLCVDICPTNALVMSSEREIVVSPELCIHCKACQNICPRGEIHVTIDRISHLPIESATWVTVLERFASSPAATKELAAKSMKKLRQTAESRARDPAHGSGGS
jgi:electron transport complex protein RnfD